MALDAAMLFVTAQELNARLAGARVDRLSMPARDEAVFVIRDREGSEKLLLSARSGSCRIHITTEEFSNPVVPPAFCMLLRKHLQNGRLVSVQAADSERVMLLNFESINDLGDRVNVQLSVELMGRYSNLVLVDRNGIILDAVKRIDEEMSDKRQVLPGIPFTLPPAQEGHLPFFSTEPEEIVRAACATSKPLSAALLGCTAGIGPVLCREASHRTNPADPSADTLSDAEKEKLCTVLQAIRAAAETGEGRQFGIVLDRGRPIEFSFFPLTQYGDFEVRVYESASELFDAYYLEKGREERARSRSHDLKKQVSQLRERAVRRQASRTEELSRTELAAQKQRYGELLTVYMSQIQKGAKSVRLTDYYTGEEVEIALDPRLSPNANAQKYFRDYRKLSTAAQVLGRLLEEGEREIAYLDSVRYEIDAAEAEEDFAAIREELRNAGYLRGSRPQKGKLRRPKLYFEYRVPGGFTVLCGRSNTSNEKLTFKEAGKRDIWFHAKNVAGSHTVLFCDGEKPSDEALTAAAKIAALHSSAPAGVPVTVDYTEIRNVRKQPEGKVGMVLYVGYHTAFVTPDPAEIERWKIGMK